MRKKECKEGQCKVNIPDLSIKHEKEKKWTKRIRQNV
ncbi:MAG: hypothetical protein H8E89_04625 [Candidatus Nitrosopelagicus sp.]|nr:hypothetical protein [Candidatus Nitrosopelagicus sp.]